MRIAVFHRRSLTNVILCTCLLLAVAFVGGCGKSDSIIGTWYLNSSSGMSPPQGFEFQKEGKVFVTDHGWGDKQEQASYDIPAEGQVRLTSKDGHVMTLNATVKDDILTLSPTDDKNATATYRRLKSDETIAKAFADEMHKKEGSNGTTHP